jgi:hypothetical protein
VSIVFISDHQSPEVLEPSEETLDFPPSLVAPEFAAILGPRFFTPPFVRGNHFGFSFTQQPPVQGIAVVGLISNQTPRDLADKAAIDSRLSELYFMGRSACNVSGDRKTSSVCDGHDLGAFAASCLADSKTPFFAGEKVPSMNASRMSMPPRSYKSSASSKTMRLKTPCRTHCWNRRWHVWYAGYRCGTSFQGAPVRNIHKMPLSTSRGLRAGRPRPSFFGVGDKTKGSIRVHCSFVSSIPNILYIQTDMSSFFLR